MPACKWRQCLNPPKPPLTNIWEIGTLTLLHVGRIGGRPKGNAHLRNVNRSAPMPNLENLRKQAKLILRWHRDRYYPVAAQIRSGLPRYGRMTDSEILAQSFKLSDAQELVARQQGFESWQALKTGLETMSDHAETIVAKAVIVDAEPQLFVADIKASCAFFISSSVLPPYLFMVSRRSMRKSNAMAHVSTYDALRGQ
jgi:hypothetical protein